MGCCTIRTEFYPDPSSRTQGKLGRNVIDYCPIHEGAPDLLAALQSIATMNDATNMRNRAQVAIGKVQA